MQLRTRIEGGGTRPPGTWGVDSEYGTLRDVLVGPIDHFTWQPGNAVCERSERVGLKFDFSVARSQYGEMVDVYRQADVKVHHLAADPALPNPNTSGYAACNGAADGACNQGNLNLYYAGGSQASYAVEFCDPTLGGFSDWYLPAICELGYDTTAGSGSSCGTASSPGLQNIRSNLADSAVPGTGLANGIYFASTESSLNPQLYAWLQYMATGLPQVIVAKQAAFQVRCVRALTQ